MSQFAHPQCSAPTTSAGESPFQQLEGGVKVGEMVVIAAKSGAGKSAFDRACTQEGETSRDAADRMPASIADDGSEPQRCTDYLNDRT